MKSLVLVARGLQAGALGCYGNQWIDTPALDALAAEGVIFDQHFADAADAVGARRSWRSGHYCTPESAGGPPDLLDAFRRQNVLTCLIVDDSRPVPPGFDAGWDEVEHVTPEGDETALESVLAAVRSALERLATREHWLLWVDLGTLLPPWDVPEEFQTAYFQEEPDEENEEEDEAEEEDSERLTPLTEVVAGPVDPEDDELHLRMVSSYAAAISYLDAGVGEMLEAIRDQDVAVLFTADHGQALGEHGLAGTGRAWLYNEIIHVPLIMRLPDGTAAGRRVAALTQAVDLAPTLAAPFEVDPGPTHGHDLLPLVRGETEQVREYAWSGLEVDGAIEWALRSPEWSFLLPVRPAEADAERGPQLYVKPDDRWEVNNVVQHHLELADGLERTLRDFVAATRQPGPLRAPPLPNATAEKAG
jgi:arylsulfatase A-like enzyme